MKPFRLLTAAVFAAAVVPRLIHRGMFVDGLTYASIARNLAEGRGTFWEPAYTETLYPRFHEHPPLGFWLQSLWFRLLGDHLYVERTYSLAAAALTAALIAATWRTLTARKLDRAATPDGAAGPGGEAALALLWWWPVLLWIAVPVVSWAIVGNLLETTVTVFTTAAMLAALAAVSARSTAAALGYGMVSGGCIAAAALTKGPVGLFPVAAPLCLAAIPGSRRVGVAIAAQWGTVACCVLAAALAAQPRAALGEYLSVQVMAALAGSRELAAGRFRVVEDLVQGVLLPFAGLGALALAGAGRFVAPTHRLRRESMAFLLLGAAGSLPILVSSKQAGHYLVPSVPPYAIASGLLIAPTLMSALRRAGASARRWISAVNLLVLVGTAAAAGAPGVGRDRARVADLDALEPFAPYGAVIGLCPAANGDWGLHAWFERRFRISLDAARPRAHRWLLQTAADTPDCRRSDCMPASPAHRALVLLRCPSGD